MRAFRWPSLELLRYEGLITGGEEGHGTVSITPEGREEFVRLLTTRLRKLFSGVVPRLLDVLQTPRKITEAVGGTVMLTLSFVICLYACVSAFGGDASFTAVAVVFLAGNAIGSAAPTPGGLVAVEGALVFGLTAAGVPYAIATSAVLLYRLLTFWLPVLPGWASFTWLQRHDAI